MTDNNSSHIERAIADLAILTAAYPDEIETDPNIFDNENVSNSVFPLVFTLTLSSENSHLLITMEMPLGYPTTKGIEIQSARLNGKTISKIFMERVSRSIREMSQSCLEYKEESGLSVCQAAMDTWEECCQQQSLLQIHDNISSNENNPVIERDSATTNKIIEWISGEPFLEKKSTFLAHMALIKSEEDVKIALSELIDTSTKIQRASHNMYAYRLTENIEDKNGGIKKILKYDNDDDGEDGAGSKLALLLERRKENGVLIVVSRWFGGTLLGPRRFAYIVNVAKNLLDSYQKREVSFEK